MSRMFFDDRIVWAISILLAVLLWVNVTGARAGDVQRTFSNLPVQWRDLPDDLDVLEMEPSTVNITVRGMREVMQDVSREDFIATVSLTGAEEGEVDYFVTVSVPRGVQLVQVNPQTVSVTVEESVEEVHPVTIEQEGVPDVALAEPSVDPAQVVVNGPRSLVGEVSEVVAPISVEGATESISERVVCSALDDRGRVVRGVIVVPRQVDIHMPEQATQATAEVPVRPLILSYADSDVVVEHIEVEPDVVSLRGDEEAIEGLEYVYTMPVDMMELAEEYIEQLQELNEGETMEVTMDLEIDSPEEEELGLEISVDPETVTVNMDIKIQQIDEAGEE